MRRLPKLGIGVLIASVAAITSCGTSRPAASHPSSTSLPPTTITAPTTTVPYTGPKLTVVSSVSCADATHCWAGASAGASGNESAILASSDGGATWAVQQTFPGVDGIGLDCPSDTHCLAVGGRSISNEPPLLISTTDGGTTWSTQPMTSGVFGVDAISCLNDSDCWLVAEKPEGFDMVMATTDWGGSWTVQDQSTIEVSMGVGFDISCPSTALCVVVGIGALTTTNGGSSWQKHTFTGDSPGELNVVSCPSVSLCVAEEVVTTASPATDSTGIYTSNDGGASWHVQLPTVGGGVAYLGSLSCPTTAVCVSVGLGYTYTSGGPPSGQYTTWGAVEKTTDGGNTWTGVKETQASNLFGLSCAAGTTDCVAVGYSAPSGVGVGALGSAGVILRTVDGGSTWTEAPLPGG